MYYGKQICESLKKVRRDIAKAAGIKYEPAKCDHKGDCPGTCPQCEYELQTLEKEVSRVRAYGKVALVAGLAIGLTPLTADATTPDVKSKKRSNISTQQPKPKPRPDFRRTAGVPLPPRDHRVPNGPDRNGVSRPDTRNNNGNNIDSTSVEQPERLMGDVVAPVRMQPEFPGGEEAMLKFIGENLATPEGLTEEKTTVVVATVSNLDGRLSEIQVLESCGDSSLDREALRVVGLMPPFNVYVLNDEPLKATIPVVFTPKDND